MNIKSEYNSSSSNNNKVDINSLLNDINDPNSEFHTSNNNSRERLNNNKSNNEIIFPILKNTEIITYLKHKNYNIEINQITSPQSMYITELFVSLMSNMKLINKSELNMTYDELDKFEFNNLHDKPIYLGKFFLLSKVLFQDTLGITDYCSSDVFYPQEKRVQRLLSGLISLSKIHDTKAGIIANCKLNYQELNSKMKKAKEDNYHFQEEYHNSKDQVEINKALADENYKELSKYNEMISKKKEELNQILNSIKNIEIEKQSLELSKSEVNSVINLIEQHINTLVNQQISSPEKLNNRLKNQTATISSMNMKIEKLKLLNINYSRLIDVLKVFTESIHEIDITKQSLFNVEEDIKKILEEIDENKANINNISSLLILKNEEFIRYTESIQALKHDKIETENNHINIKNKKKEEMKVLLERIKELKLIKEDKNKLIANQEKENLNLEGSIDNMIDLEEKITKEFREKSLLLLKYSGIYKGSIKKLHDSPFAN